MQLHPRFYSFLRLPRRFHGNSTALFGRDRHHKRHAAQRSEAHNGVHLRLVEVELDAGATIAGNGDRRLNRRQRRLEGDLLGRRLLRMPQVAS